MATFACVVQDIGRKVENLAKLKFYAQMQCKKKPGKLKMRFRSEYSGISIRDTYRLFINEG